MPHPQPQSLAPLLIHQHLDQQAYARARCISTVLQGSWSYRSLFTSPRAVLLAQLHRYCSTAFPGARTHLLPPHSHALGATWHLGQFHTA